MTEPKEVQVAAKRAQRGDAQAGEIAPRLVEQDVETARREGQSVIQVLEVLGWTPEDIERLMSEVPPGGWLEGFFRFFIKSRNSRRKAMNRNVLDEALRNVSPEDVTILGKGMKEKDGYTQFNVTRTVETVGSLLNPTSAIQQIEAALRDWAAAGQIDLALP